MGMPHKAKTILDNTDDNRTYRILYKLVHADCSWCPWHRGDNRGTHKKWRGRYTPRHKTFGHETWRDYVSE